MSCSNINFADNNEKCIDTTRKKRKIYRNDNCPCGSGKKYKKCCINNLKQ